MDRSDSLSTMGGMNEDSNSSEPGLHAYPHPYHQAPKLVRSRACEDPDAASVRSAITTNDLWLNVSGTDVRVGGVLLRSVEEWVVQEARVGDHFVVVAAATEGRGDGRGAARVLVKRRAVSKVAPDALVQRFKQFRAMYPGRLLRFVCTPHVAELLGATMGVTGATFYSYDVDDSVFSCDGADARGGLVVELEHLVLREA